MNDELYKIENVPELSPEEEAAIDRLLAQTAQADDAQVDYGALLEGVKARAAREGILVFPSAKAKEAKTGSSSEERRARRRSIVRSLLAGVAVAAAVLVVGFGAIRGADLLFPAKEGPSQAADNSSNESKHGVDAVIATLSPASATSKPAGPADHEDVTTPSFAPVYHATDEPILTEDPLMTPLPTEFPVRGGLIGYVILDYFETDPEEADELVPEGLPGFMDVKRIDDPEIETYAYGVADKDEYYYTCSILHDLDTDLGLGVARYKADDTTGKLEYLWRISENTYLNVEFRGFDRFAAEDMLLSLVKTAQE